MNQRQCYQFSIADLAAARGPIPELAFDGAGPNHLAAALEEALRYPGYYQQWKQLHTGPDADDASLGAIDDQAQAKAKVADLAIDLQVITSLPMRVLRQRLSLLIGDSWQLRDVRTA